MNRKSNNEGREKFLDSQMLSFDRCKKRAYVCSPLRAETNEKILENMRTARAYMAYAAKKMNLYARAPHAYLPLLLSEHIPAERALALDFGLRLLEQSEIVLVCGTRISKGMCAEIARAAMLNMKIITFDREMYLQVRKLVTQAGGCKSCVSLDEEHTALSFDSMTEYIQDEVIGDD